MTITPPIGLAFIAASLEQEGHDIQVVDAVTMAPKTKTKYLRGYLVGATYAEIIERFSPETEIVGITVTFTHEWISAVRLIELIREALPNVVIVLGGGAHHLNAGILSGYFQS